MVIYPLIGYAHLPFVLDYIAKLVLIRRVDRE